MQNVIAYWSLWCSLLSSVTHTRVSASVNHVEVDRHAEFGMELLARGQYVDALTHLHVAVENDSKNYLMYYRRATAYLAIGKSKMALMDLDMVTELKPDFISAWVQRGNILLKQGRLDEAHINLEYVLRKDPDNVEALQQYNLIEPVQRHVHTAQMYMEERNCHEAIPHLSGAIEICPWYPLLRNLRADCKIMMGNAVGAIVDLKAVTKLRADSTEAHHKLSLLHYNLGEAEESLNEIRECLKLDPEDKACYPHYKKVKKLASLLSAAETYFESGKFSECLDRANAIVALEKEIKAYLLIAKTLQCHCYNKGGFPLDAIASCSEALQMDENVDLLCHRAEAFINNEELEEALRDYQKAQRIDESEQCAKEGIKRVTQLQKMAKRRDYYKILGVSRTATKREILKAYRKLAQKWHPDGYSGEQKKMAEKEFIIIAAAKEVLTDPEKREKFDRGEDPLDNEFQQHQHGFNPYAQDFNPFNGQGPFQFRFHFN